ncbi:MAG: neutral/alkaline non-lysosomal ceramidase N-terminal domain-containing protein [Cetobacterium sp.]
MNIKLGFAKQKVIFPKNIQLAGYAKERLSNSVHDDIFVKTIIFEKDNQNLLLVQLDTLCIDKNFLDYIKTELKEYKFKEIFISATHTHSSPGGLVDTNQGFFKGQFLTFGRYRQDIVDLYLDKIKLCIIESIKNLSVSKVRNITFNLNKKFYSNRNNQDIPIDNSINILEFLSSENKKILLFNLSCHPTILNGDNLCLSNDFPGYISSELEKEYEMVSFFNGSCGDISTRFHKKESNFKEVERIGKGILEEIHHNLVICKTEFKDMTNLKTLKNSYKLRVKKIDSEEIANKKLEIAELNYKNNLDLSQERILKSCIEGAQSNLTLTSNFSNVDFINFNVDILELNDIKIVFIPGEIYSSLTNIIKSKKEKIFIYGYSNGYLGYIPDYNSYLNPGYEVLSSPYEKGQGEVLINSILDLLGEE